jgi:hypothetical protein
MINSNNNNKDDDKAKIIMSSNNITIELLGVFNYEGAGTGPGPVALGRTLAAGTGLVGVGNSPSAAARFTAYSGSSKMKYVDMESSNEFGNEMHTPELVMVAIVLALWVLSLRKLVKHFDKLRSTQYREIPYKYRMKDPENLSHVKIVNNQSESVIYSRDPVKQLRSKSIATCADDTARKFSSVFLSKISNGNSPFGGDLTPCSSNRQRRKMSEYYTSATFSTASINTYKKAFKRGLTNEKANMSNSLMSLKLFKSSCAGANSGVAAVAADCGGGAAKRHANSEACYYDVNERTSTVGGCSEESSNLLNPLLLSPFIRRSMLDLHQKSVENLAMKATASNENLKEGLLCAANITSSGGTTTVMTTTTAAAATTSKAKRSRFKAKPVFNYRLRDYNDAAADNVSTATDGSMRAVKFTESPV